MIYEEPAHLRSFDIVVVEACAMMKACRSVAACEDSLIPTGQLNFQSYVGAHQLP